MNDKYTWLTVDEAVKELEEGREVVLTYAGSDYYMVFCCLDMFKKERDNYPNCVPMIRKPLTPEQIIAAGTPLLAYVSFGYALIERYNTDMESKTMYTNVKSNVRFVTNEDDNYVTIKDGVAEEVLR